MGTTTSGLRSQEKSNQSSSKQDETAGSSSNLPPHKSERTSGDAHEVNEKKIGVPHIDTEYWRMLREGKTKSLTNAFQQQLVTCNTVIVPTSGHTIVHESIVLDRREYFKLCEVYGADWDKPDLNGVTPLMKAVALNRINYVERLLELGADTSKRDNRGLTAIDYGQLYESYDAVDMLKQYL